MSIFLDEINNEFEEKEFDEMYIDDIFFVKSDESYDEVSSLIKKYSLIRSTYKNIAIESNEAKIIIDNYKKDYNVLIRATLDFLISNSSFRGNSNLLKDCCEYINLFFKKIEIINGGLPLLNLSTVLKWTIYKYPNERENLGNIIYSSLINSNKNAIKCFSLSNHLLTNKELLNLISKNQYYDIFHQFYKLSVDRKETLFYMDIYNNYLKYFDINDKSKYKIVLKRYCDFIFNNIKNINDNIKQTELQKVRQYMDYLKDYGDEDYLIIDNELDRVNKEQLDKLKSHTFSLPKETLEKFNEGIERNKSKFKELSNMDKIQHLLYITKPLSIVELKTTIEKSNGLSGLIKENILDQDGRVINFDKLSVTQDFSLKASREIAISIGVYFDLWFTPFYCSFKMDNDTKKYIKNIISNSCLIDTNRIELMTKLFIDFFNQKYEQSVFNIVLELEESLRYYFKNCGMNIIKRDGSGDYIGLNNIFNDFDKNSYRDELLKVIDKDYYFTLKWFLTDEYGFDLRDKISHRIKSINLFNSTFAIYICIHIFRLYWGFKKD